MTRVIVFADRCGSELEPLTTDYPVALLPIAAKPLLVHCLEDLALAGLVEVLLVISRHAEAIKNTLGSGARWGLTISYLLSRGEELPIDVLRRLQVTKEPALLLRGDVLRGPCLKNFLEAAAVPQQPACELVFDTQSAQSAWVPDVSSVSTLGALTWPPAFTVESRRTIDLDAGVIYPLRTLADYHRANLDASAGRIPGLLLPGRPVAIGLTVGRQSRISPRSVRQGITLVGSNCRIDNSALLHGEVVISDNVLVDREAEIEDSVILPNTYIGQLVHVRNAIVKGSDLIRVDTGAQLQVADTFLLADLGTNGTSEYFMRPLNKLAGLVLLLISLPLWLVALSLATLERPRQPIQRRVLRGNHIELNEFGIRQRRNFIAWEFACRGPILRYLPRLVAVVRGDLKLIGTLPISEYEAAERKDAWQRAADRAPSGLIGPSQLLLPHEVTKEDVILSDALYARQRSIAKDLALLGLGVRQLFRRVNWTGT